MTHASVFSGIGGPEVAATMLGWENLFHCEINPFGRRVLDYWYPNSKSYEDITTTDFSEWRGRVNVLTGGFPCQPFSYAGKRGGAQDDRYLWPYMFRCIDQVRPDWVVAENVAGILTMVEQGEVSEVASAPALFDTFDRVRRYQLRETFTLQRICDDLESHGYAVQPVLVPACGVGAPHRRDRVFIIGHRVDADTECERLLSSEHEQRPRPEEGLSSRGGGRYVGEGETESKFSCTTGRIHGEIADVEISQRRDHAEDGGATEKMRHTPHPDSHRGREVDEHMESELADGAKPVSNGRERNAADTSEQCRERLRPEQSEAGRAAQVESGGRGGEGRSEYQVGERWRNFPSVSPVHRGNDGLPFDVDRFTVPPIPKPPTYGKGDPKKYPFSKWRTEALKAYGNAIVPQVMYEIFRAIQQVEQDL